MQNSYLYMFGSNNVQFSDICSSTHQIIKLCRGYMFSNAVRIMIFISDIQYYVPIKLCKTTGSIHLFKITGMLKPENVKLNQNYIWDTLQIDWKEVNMTFNSNKKNLTKLNLRSDV